jgi:hypothetical protein
MGRITELERRNSALKAENDRLREELLLAFHRQFGNSSEKSLDQGVLPSRTWMPGRLPRVLRSP